MFHVNRAQAWVAVIVSLLLSIAAIVVVVWSKKQPISLRGAIVVADADARKELPIAGVEVSTTANMAASPTKSDPSGLFILKLRKPVRHGQPITIHFSHPQYHPLDLKDYVGNKLYVVHLVPNTHAITPVGQPTIKVGNVRVRYTVQGKTELNVGSAVKTFEVQNKGDVLCKGQHPCSPDGQWKASLASTSLDAGPGNVFRDARASCIAGPCPFTRIESDDFARAGQTITVTIRDWSDPTTFLIEAEVFRPMVTQNEHWSYPVVFGDRFSFTLPSGSESVSIEADLDGQTIIFPLGPTVLLSWANCDYGPQDKASVYRCALKSGYRFN